MPTIFIAIAAGIAIVRRSGADNMPRKGLTPPWRSIAIVSAITPVAAPTALPTGGERFPTGHGLAPVPWYDWTDKLFGPRFAATLFASPEPGAGAFVVTTSTATSLLDHQGVTGSTGTGPAGAASRAGCA